MTYDEVKVAIEGMQARNEWLFFGPLEVYVRKSTIPAELGYNFQIATVGVKTDQQKKGIFTRFLEFVERYVAETNMAAVYVENVLNPNLETFLAKKGYDKFSRLGSQEYPPCMYKIIVSEKH
jgi:hypothetical protein